MRSHVKASTAGSTQRQAGRLGRIFRGAFATRDASLDSKGSGAPKARRFVLPLAVLALSLALAVPQAGALKFHAFKEVFGSAAQPGFETRAIAIDQSSGDVLVMDATGDDSIKRFNPDGTADNFSALGTNVIDGKGGPDATPQNGLSFSSSSESQIAIDNSGTATDGNIYVTQSSPNLINVFSSTGAYLGQLTAAGATNFTEACGVAVDSSGAVYVGDYNSGIHRFVPAANPPVDADHVATFTTTTQPCTLAAGTGPTAGFLFPAKYQGPISKIDSSTGELKYAVAPGAHTTVAIDTGNGHVYGLGTFNSLIEEYDASGAGSATTVSNTSFSGAQQGLAVRGSSGDIYLAVSPATTDKIRVYSGVVSTAPDVTTTAATNVGTTTATLNGTVNPDGLGLSECKFEYGKTTAYGQSVPCAESTASIGSGTSPVAVHADISGLDPNGAVYHFRLVAVNPETSTNGNDQSLATLGPEITDTWAEDVTVTEAVLKAEINPKGDATTYRFEYGPTPAYGNETAELNVGSDSSPHKVQLGLSGLQPGTTYHYRVIATNGVSVDEGPDREIRTFRPFSAETDCPNQDNRYGAGANLPDCRAYELVSPLDKNNGDIDSPFDGSTSQLAALASRTQSTPSGEKLAYGSYRAFADAGTVPWVSQYIAQRVAGEGWQTHSLNQPGGAPFLSGLAATVSQYQFLSEDLCHGWMRSFFDSPGFEQVPGIRNVYRRDDRLCGAEGFQRLAPGVPPLAVGAQDNPEILGASADGSHMIFALEAKLVPEGTENRMNLYESSAPGAPPRLVCILPNGEPWGSDCTAGGWSDEIFEGHLTGAISEDGERIFWTDAAGRVEGKVYVRIGGTETLPVSQAGEEEAGTSKSLFWGAASDGSRAVYTTGDSSIGEGHLFAFHVDAEATEPIAGGVYGVVGIGEDARRMYFVSQEALPGSGQNSEGDEAIAGQPNLYLYDADEEGGAFTFIGRVSSEDVAVSSSSLIAQGTRFHLAHVSPDGLHVVFASKASLTGYDNKNLTNGSLNPLAYVYDAQSDELHCASCNPSGARGRREIAQDARVGSEGVLPISAAEPALQPARLLSEDGSRLFFESAVALDPRDSNGKVDLYQWEEEGTGGCDATDPRFAPSADGCVELISTGTSDFDVQFAEASVDGDNIFFYTKSSLVPSDYGLRDIYDARVGGGFPLPPEAPECVGDACQGIPPAPNDPTPASAGFRGAGDPAPRKAQRRRCRTRVRKGTKQGKANRSKAKQKKAKRCRRNNGRAGR